MTPPPHGRHPIVASISAASVLVIPFFGRSDGEDPVVYRALFDHGVHGQLVLDRQGLIRRANPSACRLFGWGDAQLHGRPFSELLTPGTRTQFGQALVATRDPNSARGWTSLEGRSSDGSTFPIEVELILAIHGAEGSFGVIVRDGRDAPSRIRGAPARFNPGQLLIASRIQELV